MKKFAALSALAVAGIAGSAFGVVTGNIEIRFVTIAGTGALPNQGTGLADGTVLGPNTVISADNPLIRQRIAIQARAINIAGDFQGLGVDGSGQPAPGSTFAAQNLGMWGFGGALSFADGTIAGQSFGFSIFPGVGGTTLGGTVVGNSWSGFQGSIPSTQAAQSWSFANPNPPAPANIGNTGAGGAWVEVARFRWESSDLTARTIGANFVNNDGVTRAYVGNSFAAVTPPNADEELDGSVQYANSLANVPVSVGQFSFLIQGVQNVDPDAIITPGLITADPFVNPDAMNLVLASFSDDDGDNVDVDIVNDGGIGALGGTVSIVGDNGLTPQIVVTWDAPNAAIGQVFNIPFTFTDGNGNVLNGSTSVTVVPAPGALALLGLGGLVAGRRRRA